MWTEKRKILSTFSSSSSSKHLQFPVIHRSHPNPLFSSLIIIFLFYLLIFSSIRLLHVSPSTQTNPNSQFPIPFFLILPKLFSSPFPVPNSQFPIPFFYHSSQAFQFPIPVFPSSSRSTRKNSLTPSKVKFKWPCWSVLVFRSKLYIVKSLFFRI